MTTILKPSMLLTISAIAAATVAAPRAAGADSSFPATVCRQDGTSSDVRYTSQGRVYNDHTVWRYLTCPFIRVRSGWDGDQRIHVHNGSFSSNLTCTVYSTNWDGGAGWWESDSTSTTSAFTTLDYSVDSFYSLGSSYARCSLPPKTTYSTPAGIALLSTR